jgi:hypothetical protein
MKEEKFLLSDKELLICLPFQPRGRSQPAAISNQYPNKGEHPRWWLPLFFYGNVGEGGEFIRYRISRPMCTPATHGSDRAG